MIKPIPRWQIALAKMLVAAGLTAALVVPAVVLDRAPARRRHGDATDHDRRLRGRLPASAAAPTPSAFMALSVFTSRALLLGLAYTLIWEGVLSGLLEGTQFLSIRQATLGLAAALGVDVPGEPLAPEVSVAGASRSCSSVAFLLASWQPGAVRDPRRRLTPRLTSDDA